jgi:homoserine kinase
VTARVSARSRHVIRLPASIGNVGPGFDTLGLALSLYMRVTVRRRIQDGQGRLHAHFAAERPVAQNGIARAFEHWPFRVARPPSIEVDVASDIPERAGLGSSAAAAIAGLRLRELCDGRRTIDELLAAAAALEGHPDNAAAVLHGGLTSSRVADDGGVTVARWRWPAAWRIVVATPRVQLATKESRRALPLRVPLRDAVFNLQRVALLLHAVDTRSAVELMAALQDRLHQPYREPLVPVLSRALSLRHPDAMGACLSGAGPSVAVFARRNPRGVERALATLYRKEGVPCTVRILRVHQ